MKNRLHHRIASCFGYDLKRKSKNVHTFMETHVKLLLERHRVNCVIDVGAHKGEYARSLRNAGYQGRIVSFEPVAAYFAKLAEACARDEAWRCHSLALGQSDCTETMSLYGAQQWASFFPTSQFAQQHYPDAARSLCEEKVLVRRLDSIWDDIVDGIHHPRAFLKMDTQGYDLNVFAGAAGCLDYICGLQSELSVTALYQGVPDYVQALTEYRGQGFEVTGFFPVFREEDSLILGEVDVVMMRRHSHEHVPDGT